MKELEQGLKQFFNEWHPVSDIKVGYQVKDVHDLYRIWFTEPDTIFHMPHYKRYFKITKATKNESAVWLFHKLLVEPDEHSGSELPLMNFIDDTVWVVYKTGDGAKAIAQRVLKKQDIDKIEYQMKHHKAIEAGEEFAERCRQDLVKRSDGDLEVLREHYSNNVPKGKGWTMEHQKHTIEFREVLKEILRRQGKEIE